LLSAVLALIPASVAAADITIGTDLVPNSANSGTCAFSNPANRPCVIVITTPNNANETMAATCTGTVTRFRINGIPRAGNSYRLRVVRGSGGNTYAGIASSDPVTIAIDGVNEYATNLPISAGDRIAIDFQNSTDDAGVRWRYPGGQNVYFAFPADGVASGAPNFVETTSYLINADVACTAGPGPTMQPIPPTIAFRGAKAKSNGSVDVTAEVSGPGRVTVSQDKSAANTAARKRRISTLVKSVSKDAAAAGQSTLNVKPTKAAKAKLKRGKRVRVKLLLTYTDSAGASATARKTVTMKMKRRR
jgi:hypothetical protein